MDSTSKAFYLSPADTQHNIEIHVMFGSSGWFGNMGGNYWYLLSLITQYYWWQWLTPDCHMHTYNYMAHVH